jgi:Galactose oxidase-like, Early set domain
MRRMLACRQRPARAGWRRWLPILPALTLFSVGCSTAQGYSAPKGHSTTSRGYGASATPRADPAAARIGQWAAPFDIGVVGIHSQVMPDGKVLLWAYPRSTVGTWVVVLDPATRTFTNVSMSYQRDAFCSGNDLLPNGEVFLTGGHLYNGVNPSTHENDLGSANTDIFDPAAQAWTPGPTLDLARWYPTNVELGNGHILIFAGQVRPGKMATTVDEYDPATNTMSTLPATADRTMPVYPRMTLLPDGKILNSEPDKGTELFNPATNRWSWLGNTRLGQARSEGNTVLLPGLNKVLIAGGRNGVTGATNTAEVIDFSKANPAWHYTGSMRYARAYANAVLLADGTVLEVGGGTGGPYKSPVYTAELYNPASGTWSTMAAQTAPRIYHSTAVLLPSGQVLSAGMDSGTYQETAEIYSPPYLFKGPRPTISSAPKSVGYGKSFEISTPDAASITRVALVKPSGATHALGQDQRYVNVSITHASGTRLTVTAPPDGNHAPPGWYMLFILNSSGVPSVASWVQVG